ncbi:type I methionyl aminopeptidase [Streptosporangium sp. 'caverna']|uniref:type I methionyl aminopeptidase n=1 Tax=Streptosporangium sp. 'caverna' TaxID=2202249 RepID=UPI000D7E1127|nr:type I methionyl aminopeptidase [Streptosporangium sp. 'caverna']AWS48154.1 type I methionyl aminopeptidase [Streptosporangium sp. 'caverna']
MFKKNKHGIQIKTPEQLEKMRAAGLVVGRTLQLLRESVRPGMTPLDLDGIAEKAIRDEGAIPSFKGYQGFPATICASVNHEVVHGIPGDRRALQEGDIISIDCGAILDGWHGDAAVTVPIGEVDPKLTELMRVTEEAMWRGIAVLTVGRHLSDIGHAVEKYVRSQGRYGIPQEYGGHGIGTEMHMDPWVANHGKPGRGPRFEPGMCFAVEPMVNLGTDRTKVLADDWTVITVDGKSSAHFEHSVAVTDDGPLVLTALDGGAERLADLAKDPEQVI